MITTNTQRLPFPPFTRETAIEKVRLAENGWNTRDPQRVALAYTVDSWWRNRAEFPQGRPAIIEFLTRKWKRELDYRLIKELWAYDGSRIAVRFAYDGKGRKERSVPLWPKTAKVLHQWRKRQPGTSTSTIFPSLRGNVLTRDSVNHLLREIVQLAIPACPSLATKRVTPHLIRHGTAMHLLQSGVDITVIALWLGHEDVQTTHVYLQQISR